VKSLAYYLGGKRAESIIKNYTKENKYGAVPSK
jgi:hypothetical protein